MRMASEGRTVILLVDNASSHMVDGVEPVETLGLKTLRLNNTLIAFLPADVTAHAQPLEQGAFAAFKRGYCHELLRWYTEQFDQETGRDLAKVGIDAHDF